MQNDNPRRRSDGLKEIAGLWERASANGRAYIGGRTPDDEDLVLPAGSLVMVFPNDSDNPRAPAFRLLFAPPRDDQPGASATPGGDGFARLKAGGQPAPATPATPARGRSPMAEVATDDLGDPEDFPF